LGLPKFQRLYVCLGAAKEGFKAGCRSIIGLDWCFLKSVYVGQLLTDVGIDANNETWVIAYVVVESECKESWIWFLELLVKDCQIVNQFGFTFISDKQKDLLPTFEQVVPNCDHRFYARHLFSNYSVFFKAKSLRDKDRPILSMFEYIRCKLMRRIQGRRDKIPTWNRPICPRIFKKVEGNKAKIGACVAMWSSGGKFQ
ncbi:PREDICTED: transposon, partial [Prunus dulcis]